MQLHENGLIDLWIRQNTPKWATHVSISPEKVIVFEDLHFTQKSILGVFGEKERKVLAKLSQNTVPLT